MAKANDEYTGGSTTYYQVDISHPINEQAQPYIAECQDIIDALGMTFNEGNAFKALWRRCAARTLGKSKRGYTDGLYDAEKVVFYGERLVQLEQLQRRADGVEQGELPTAFRECSVQGCSNSAVRPYPYCSTHIDRIHQ